MSRNSNTHFASNLLENLICDFIGYRWVFLCSCFQFFFVFLFRKFCIFFGNRTLSNCKNSKTLACFRTFLDCLGNLLDIIRNLRDQNDICTTGHTCMKSKASNLMSHDLYNKHTAMRRSCGMDTVNGIGRNVNCTLETEGHICAINIIIDGLRKMNNIQPLLAKKIGCLLRTIASQDNQAVQAKLIIRLLHSLNFIQPIFIRNTHHLKRLSGSTQNSTSLSQYAGKIF